MATYEVGMRSGRRAQLYFPGKPDTKKARALATEFSARNGEKLALAPMACIPRVHLLSDGGKPVRDNPRTLVSFLEG